MAYIDIYEMSMDVDLRHRVAACAAEQREAGLELDVDNPDVWADLNRWEWAAAPGWADAYAYAKNLGNEAPGRDPTVITDGMILSQVQEMLTPPPPPPEMNPL